MGQCRSVGGRCCRRHCVYSRQLVDYQTPTKGHLVVTLTGILHVQWLVSALHAVLHSLRYYQYEVHD